MKEKEDDFEKKTINNRKEQSRLAKERVGTKVNDRGRSTYVEAGDTYFPSRYLL